MFCVYCDTCALINKNSHSYQKFFQKELIGQFTLVEKRHLKTEY